MKPLLIFLSGLALFGLGIVVGVIIDRGSPLAEVKVRNESGQRITLLRIEHEQGLVELKDIDSGDSRLVKFYVPGESSYSLRASFADGRDISQPTNYIEAGYHVEVTVSEKEMNASVELLSYAP